MACTSSDYVPSEIDRKACAISPPPRVSHAGRREATHRLNPPPCSTPGDSIRSPPQPRPSGTLARPINRTRANCSRGVGPTDAATRLPGGLRRRDKVAHRVGHIIRELLSSRRSIPPVNSNSSESAAICGPSPRERYPGAAKHDRSRKRDDLPLSNSVRPSMIARP